MNEQDCEIDTDVDVSKRKKTRQFRLRFDLLTLILFFAVLAAWFFYFSLRNENSLTRAAVEKVDEHNTTLEMKVESRILRLEKPDRAAVISPPHGLNDLAPLDIWDVEIPSEQAITEGGAEYKLCLSLKELGPPVFGEIAQHGTAEVTPTTKQIPLTPGRHRIELRDKFTENEFTVFVSLDGQMVLKTSMPLTEDNRPTKFGYGRSGYGFPFDTCYQPRDASDPIELQNYLRRTIDVEFANVILWLQPSIGIVDKLP